MDSIPDIQKYLLLNDSDHRNAEGVIHETVRSMWQSSAPGFLEENIYWPTELESKQISLIDVVQSLGEYITNEDSTIRSKTIQYLSQIIGEVPQSILSRQQVQVLCQFMCDRIEDGGAIEGLCNLQGFGKFDKTMAVMTFRA